jgi:hypothetical protein
MCGPASLIGGSVPRPRFGFGQLHDLRPIDALGVLLGIHGSSNSDRSNFLPPKVHGQTKEGEFEDRAARIVEPVTTAFPRPSGGFDLVYLTSQSVHSFDDALQHVRKDSQRILGTNLHRSASRYIGAHDWWGSFLGALDNLTHLLLKAHYRTTPGRDDAPKSYRRQEDIPLLIAMFSGCSLRRGRQGLS